MSRLLLPLVASLALTPFASACDEPTLEQRLEKLAERLEAEREKAHIPGMSIVIVKGDEIVWARGFGQADIDTERAADENTVYAIGSATKALTATLVGTLVDEGKASWDDPVTRHLPYFDLQVRSDDEDAECTLRDLLSHRHGFTRMGILFIGGNTSREEILRTAAGAEPWDDFRAGFHYCNITYLAAGEAAGAAAGSTWDALMAERIFAPLGMTSSTITRAAAQKDPRLALGYRWDETDERFEHEEMFALDTIGPAGSVNSNVLDVAQWIRLQLGRGEVDGKRVISEERLLETWEPQIEIGDGASYGLGWMLREHDGRKVVEHGGNIDGFSAQIGFIPGEDLGYALLMNLSASPLQQASLGIVFDALLDEWPEEKTGGLASGVATEIVYEEYAGTFIATFATFRKEEFTVQVTDRGLALDIPSQRTFDLKAPDAEGRWTFALTDQIAVSFQRDDEGAVVGLTVHQGPFNFEVPRKGTPLEAEVPAEELQKYVGIYIRDKGGKQVELFLEDGLLTMDNRGKWLAFRTPDATGHASLRARADQGATFQVDAEGNVDSFVFHGDAGDQGFTRLKETAPELPSVEEVFALRKTGARRAAIEAAGGTKITGKVHIAQAGVHGTVTIYTQGTERFASHLDFGKFGRIDSAVRDGQAWRYNSMRGLDVLKGDQLAQALLSNPTAVEGDWNDYFDSVEVLRNDLLNDRPVHVLRLTKGTLPSYTYWVDAEHGDVLRVKQILLEGPMRIPVTINYSDFRETGEVRVAQRTELENPMTGRTVLTFEHSESGLELGDEVFDLDELGSDDPRDEEGAGEDDAAAPGLPAIDKSPSSAEPSGTARELSRH